MLRGKDAMECSGLECYTEVVSMGQIAVARMRVVAGQEPSLVDMEIQVAVHTCME